jgi:hypothetical protein
VRRTSTAGASQPAADVVRASGAVGTAVGTAGRATATSNSVVGTARDATVLGAVGTAARHKAGMGSRPPGVGYLDGSRLGSGVDDWRLART